MIFQWLILLLLWSWLFFVDLGDFECRRCYILFVLFVSIIIWTMMDHASPPTPLHTACNTLTLRFEFLLVCWRYHGVIFRSFQLFICTPFLSFTFCFELGAGVAACGACGYYLAPYTCLDVLQALITIFNAVCILYIRMPITTSDPVLLASAIVFLGANFIKMHFIFNFYSVISGAIYEPILGGQ